MKETSEIKEDWPNMSYYTKSKSWLEKWNIDA